MGKFTSVTCENAKPDLSRDRMLGEGDGLFLRVRPSGTKTWLVEDEFAGRRTKYTIGVYECTGANGDRISDWLRHGRLSLAQAHAIAGNFKIARRAGNDPVAEWEAVLAEERAAEALRKAGKESETAKPTLTKSSTSLWLVTWSARRVPRIFVTGLIGLQPFLATGRFVT